MRLGWQPFWRYSVQEGHEIGFSPCPYVYYGQIEIRKSPKFSFLRGLELESKMRFMFYQNHNSEPIHSVEIADCTLTSFWQKFRESNGFTKRNY